ncbi:barttin isoform X9 [Alligator sinensis]|uniref:Barttin isoform X9 n=1 Tax=Alligator sinensis TaxID=38654 RepID=A0A3Q0GRP9_ALLSI|nr:barttin isoform X9 [Alligator sinensis]
MAEDKTFRYGLIMLGFFLVMIGMFIMSTDKPQVYITFCTLGVLIIAVGITWSMCQCYPKVTFAPIDAEAEKFVSHKPAVLIENEISEKNWYVCKSSQTPYTSQEEAKVYEKSLPSYDQIQMKTEGSAEDQEVQCAPAPSGSELRTGAHTQPTVQAKAEVHRDSGSDGKTYKDPAAQMETAMASRVAADGCGCGPEAPILSQRKQAAALLPVYVTCHIYHCICSHGKDTLQHRLREISTRAQCPRRTDEPRALTHIHLRRWRCMLEDTEDSGEGYSCCRLMALEICTGFDLGGSGNGSFSLGTCIYVFHRVFNASGSPL